MSRNLRSATTDQIEFLPPNVAAFGVADTADFVGFDGDDEQMFGDDGPRSRWLPAIASIVVLGLLGGGVIAASPWDSSPTATPTTTTTPATTTTAEPTTTTERVLDVATAGRPGYVLGDPGPFQLAGAWSAGPESRPPEVYADDRFDLWATPDASRTSGRWLAVTSQHSRGDYEDTWPNAIRIQAGRDTGVIMSTDDGASRLSFTSADDVPFEIGGFGFELPDLLAVAAEVRGASIEHVIDYGSLTDGVLAGLAPVVSQLVPYGAVTAWSLLSQVESGVYYFGNDGESYLNVMVGTASALDDVALRFLSSPVADLGVADQVALDALARAGTPVQLMTNDDGTGNLVAMFRLNGETITVSAYNVSVSTLIGLLPSIRPTELLEWADLIDRTNRNVLPVPTGPSDPPMPTEIVARTSVPSTIDEFLSIQMTADPATISISTNRSGWGGLVGEIASAPAVRRFSSRSTTYLVGTAEWPNTARVMRVTLEGMPPVDVPMIQIGDSTIYAAGFAFTDLLPDTVEFLDVDGNPVAG